MPRGSCWPPPVPLDHAWLVFKFQRRYFLFQLKESVSCPRGRRPALLCMAREMSFQCQQYMLGWTTGFISLRQPTCLKLTWVGCWASSIGQPPRGVSRLCSASHFPSPARILCSSKPYTVKASRIGVSPFPKASAMGWLKKKKKKNPLCWFGGGDLVDAERLSEVSHQTVCCSR